MSKSVTCISRCSTPPTPSYEVQSSIEDIADRAGLKNSMCVSSALSHLARAGFIERFDIPGKRIRGTRLLQPKKLARDLKIDRVALEERARRDRSKLKSMIEFCYADKCRQQMILEYFGEANAEVCGTCRCVSRQWRRHRARWHGGGNHDPPQSFERRRPHEHQARRWHLGRTLRQGPRCCHAHRQQVARSAGCRP